MIKASEITKSFGDIPVLRGLSISIDRGGLYGIAGRSGTGKSTLLRCINGLEKHDDGLITVDGTDLKKLSESDIRLFRKNIGMIFQNFSLLERLTSYENIALPLRCWKYKQNFIDKKVRDLLEVVGIPDKILRKPRELSGGQKQRVAIARALALDPQILLCDEATSALDPKTSKSIIALLKQINKEMGITIVFVSHQISAIKDLCSDMAILDHGKVAVSGTVDDVFNKKHTALKNFLGDEMTDFEEMNTLIIPLTGKNRETVISGLAAELGIDLTIRGSAEYKDKRADSITISFPSTETVNVKNYLISSGIQSEDYNNDIPAKTATQRSIKISDQGLSILQPEVL